MDPLEIAQMVEQRSEPVPDIRTIKTQLYQVMNGENRIGQDDATRSLLYALMQIVEKLSDDVETLKLARPG